MTAVVPGREETTRAPLPTTERPDAPAYLARYRAREAQAREQVETADDPNVPLVPLPPPDEFAARYQTGM